MGLNFYAAFTNGTNGGVTGLSPLITITKVTLVGGTLTNVLSNAAMTAVTNCSGMYMYNMTTSADMTTYDYVATVKANSTVSMDTPFGSALWSQFASGGVSGVTFPATVASPTNITGGTISLCGSLTGYAVPTAMSVVAGVNGGGTITIGGVSVVLPPNMGSLGIGSTGILTQVGSLTGYTSPTTFTIASGTSGGGTLTGGGGSLVLGPGIGSATFPATVASPTNITAASGVTLAANQDVRNVLGGIAGTGSWNTTTPPTASAIAALVAAGSINGNIGGNLLGGVGGTVNANMTAINGSTSAASALSTAASGVTLAANQDVRNVLGGIAGTGSWNTTTPPTASAIAVQVANALFTNGTNNTLTVDSSHRAASNMLAVNDSASAASNLSLVTNDSNNWLKVAAQYNTDDFRNLQASRLASAYASWTVRDGLAMLASFNNDNVTADGTTLTRFMPGIGTLTQGWVTPGTASKDALA